MLKDIRCANIDVLDRVSPDARKRKKRSTIKRDFDVYG